MLPPAAPTHAGDYQRQSRGKHSLIVSSFWCHTVTFWNLIRIEGVRCISWGLEVSPNLILRTKHEITFNISSLHKCSNYFNFLNPPLNDAPSSLFPAAAPHSSPGCQCLMIFYMKSLPPPRAVMSAHVNLPTLIELDLKSHLSNSTLLTNPFYILKF